MQSKFRIVAIFLAAAFISQAALLTPPAERAFENYVATVETRARQEELRPGFEQRPPNGAIRTEPVHGGSWQVDGGLLHDWRATALVPGARAEEMLALLRDYEHFDRYYAPEVVSSHAVRNTGEAATVMMRFRKQSVITVVLDAEFDTQSALAGGGRGFSVSRSTHVWQVSQPGSARERRRTEGDDDGFLWRLNSYWNFEERREGLLIQCEAVSLTRDVPAGLGWLIRPIIQSLPRASLVFTLTATRNALMANAMRNQDHDQAQ